MKITITSLGKTYKAKQPYPHADHVTAELCCGKIQGIGQRIADHDTYEADARCVCGKQVGILRVKLSTIFGLEEDERVLRGRVRVY